MSRIDELINEVNKLNCQLNFYKLSRQNVFNSIAVDDCHNSNAIEGNSVTHQETEILLRGETVDRLHINEVNEVWDYQAARDFILSLYMDDYSKLTIEIIQEVHSNVLGNSSSWGGYLRCQPEDVVEISNHPEIKLAEPQQVFYYLSDAVDSYNDNIVSISRKELQMSPLEIIAEFAETFIQVHPFLDGNGRTSRLLLNCLLMINGYHPIVIPVSKRDDYIKSLNIDIVSGDTNATQFKEFLLKTMIENYNQYLSNVKQSEIKPFS